MGVAVIVTVAAAVADDVRVVVEEVDPLPLDVKVTDGVVDVELTGDGAAEGVTV